MGVHSLAYGRAHLRCPCAPPLRIELDHQRPDHHPPGGEAARGISLPGSVRTVSSERGHDLRAPAAGIEPVCASSFPAAARLHSRTYAAGIAPRLAHRDLNLLEERLRPRIEPRSTTAGPPRPDPKIFALIPRHSETTDIEMCPHKSTEQRSL
jgi:hypothetical protein